MSNTTVEKKRKELSELLQKQEDEEFLDLLLQILKDKDQKEVNVILKAIWGDEGTSSSLYRFIMEMRRAVEEESEKGEAERSEAFQEKLRSRSDSSEADIKAGRTLSLDEVDRRKEELIRKHYEG
jgi:hypothetical protein